MANNTWNDLKKLVEKISVKEEVLKASNLILFGAGRNGASAYEKLKRDYSIYAFSDNALQYKGKEHKVYEGIEVIKPEQLKDVERVFVIITVTGHHYLTIKRQLQDLGIPHLTYIEYIIKTNFEKFETVYQQLLADEFSKKTYLSLLISHITCDMTHLKNVFVKNQYFAIPEFYAISAAEIFVDCGAYVGDSMERFVENRTGTFKTMYCFEPTEKTYKAMCLRRDRLLAEWALNEEQIVTERKLISGIDGLKTFSSTEKEETANRIVNDEDTAGEQIEAVSLDAYFSTKEKPTFIKADIEGAEIDLIKGATGIIRDNTPLLAICIYHEVTDLYEIPLLLKELNTEYHMAIRHHMPNYHETVLYCY